MSTVTSGLTYNMCGRILNYFRSSVTTETGEHKIRLVEN